MKPTPLRAARRDLENAVAALIDPRPDASSVYRELRARIHSPRAGSSHGAAQSQPPLWLDGSDLCYDIDATVRDWVPDASGEGLVTENRLRRLTARQWRLQDHDQLLCYAGQVTAWVKRFAALTEPKPLSLPDPCPKCHRKWAYRDLDGEQVRVAALQVTVEQAVCMACHARWPAEKLSWLGRVLGYQPLQGVL